MKKNNPLQQIKMVSIAIVMTTSVSVTANELQVDGAQPQLLTLGSPVSQGNTYIIRLADEPLATYSGETEGFEATSAKSKGEKRLNTKSKAAKKYKDHLKGKQKDLLSKASGKFGRKLDTKYTYQHAVNGFAVELTANEAKTMKSLDGVVSVEKERIEQLLTDVGPQWIGAPEIWQSNSDGPKGEGMVVAVLDTGINSDHPSFAAVGGDGYSHTNPMGSGNYLPGSYCETDPSFCNDKLIGAWDFVPGDGDVPEDNDGHGSHTASTAAGNVVLGATLTSPTTTAVFDISGVAPHANIIAYDVCQDGCPGSALVAAIDQVVIDSGNLPNGIAALNYSISGGGDPYNDTVELGFLAAVEAGIYVAASAGNSGPTPSTVAHLGPWVSTTAASTHNRNIVNELTDLSSDGASLPALSGKSFSSGYGPATIIHANTTAFDPTGQCLDPFPANTFNGEIVMCDRGTIARTAKGQNVLAGGAGGYVLGNLGQGEDTVADAHFLPAIHLGDSDGAALRDWLANNTNTTATITPFEFDLSEDNGDKMGGFSSRGPQQAFNVLKPDITAPGVDIMGAEADGQSLSSPEYQIISGTSMSSPHNAGAGALLAAAHPEWTPTEIKSVIMLTATTANTVKEDGVTPTDPFDLGAGRIDLGQADQAVLVMSESIENFLAANPALGGDPATLNLASMMNASCVGECSWTRTVTNKTKHTGHWNVSVAGVGFDTDVNVSPEAKSTKNKAKKGKNNSNNLKLKAGQSAKITVTARNYSSATGWHFGSLKLDSAGNSSPDLSMPMAVFASKASNAAVFNKQVDRATAVSGDSLAYDLNVVNFGFNGEVTVTDNLPDGTEFNDGSAMVTVNGGSTTDDISYDAETHTVSWAGVLDAPSINADLVPGFAFGFFPLANLGIAPLSLSCNGDCDDGGYYFALADSYTYNGNSYTELLMSINGTVEAGISSGGFTSFQNLPMPNESIPNNLLAPFWRDLNLNEGGNMYSGTLSAGPFRWFVVEWNDVPHFGDTSSTVSMQVWIGLDGSAAEGEISFAYGNMSTAGSNATVGAENELGTVGATYLYNGAGTTPQQNDEIVVSNAPGGNATLSFGVTTSCDDDLVINRATVTDEGDTSEVAIAVTTCE